MKKILVFGLTDLVGGIEMFYINYYRNADKKKYKIDFVCPFKKIAFEKELKDNNSKIFYVENYKKNPIKYYREIKKILKENKYDIIHVNMLSAANIMPLIIARKSKISKIIAHSHCCGISGSKLKYILHKINKIFIKHSANYYLACSDAAGKWLFTNNVTYQIVNNAIDIKKFKYNNKKRNIIRKKYNIKKSDFLLGNVGRLCSEKNQSFLIKIMRMLSNKNNIKLMLVGNGPYKEQFIDEINSNNLQDKIILVGEVNNVFDYYNAFDLFLFPSIFEGFGMAAVEAQVSGLNCIFSENIIKEVNLNKMNSVIDLSNVDEWCNKILYYKKNKLNESRNINYDIINDFDIKNEKKVIEEVYDE